MEEGRENVARYNRLRNKEYQIAEARRQAELLMRAAQRDADFWQHASIFYDRFCSVVSPSYPVTVAAMEYLGYITPSMRQQLIARTPGDRRAEASGLIAGIAFSFWLPTTWTGSAKPFIIGSRSHFWTPGASLSLLAVDASKLSQEYGLLNLYFKVPGLFEKIITVTNANVLAIPKFILGQMANQVRGAIERHQDNGG
jgi:hypothetical protein